MPLGKSPILLINLIAEGDNQKYIAVNDAISALEDSVNRALTVNMSAGGVTLTATQVTRFGVIQCTNNTVARNLNIPNTLPGDTAVPTTRMLIVRNLGTSVITVRHSTPGATVAVPGGTAAIVYCNGTDIISLGGVANAAPVEVRDAGTLLTATLSGFNFTGNIFTLTESAGTVTVNGTAPKTILALDDTPNAYTGQAGRSLRVNATATGVEFADVTPSAATIKTLYESNPDTNAFTDALETKLNGIEAGATADMTPAEIKAAYESNSNTHAFTTALRTKLEGIEGSKFKGVYATQAALVAAHPTPETGAYAYVDAGVGTNVVTFIWDGTDNAWIQTSTTGATETPASIKTKYESNPDTNAFTDALEAKLNGIEAGATADMTAAEIRVAYESNPDRFPFDTARRDKLNGIEAGATADMTAAEIKTAYESNPDTFAFTAALRTKLIGIEGTKFKGTYSTLTALTTAHPTPDAGSYAFVDAGTSANVLMYIYDGSDTTWVQSSTTGATETPESIKTKYESNPDTNAFTDALETKLNGIEAGATADQTGSEISALLDALFGNTQWRSNELPSFSVAQSLFALRVNAAGTGVEWASATSLDLTTVADANLTLSETHAGRYVRMVSSTPRTLTVPLNLTGAPVGSVMTIRQAGDGAITVSPAVGVTVNTPTTYTTGGRGSSISIIKVGANEWDMTGDLENV